MARALDGHIPTISGGCAFHMCQQEKGRHDKTVELLFSSEVDGRASDIDTAVDTSHPTKTHGFRSSSKPGMPKAVCRTCTPTRHFSRAFTMAPCCVLWLAQPARSFSQPHLSRPSQAHRLTSSLSTSSPLSHHPPRPFPS